MIRCTWPLQRTNTENSKQIFPEKELRFHSSHSCVGERYFIFPWSVCLFCCRKYVDRSWEYINRSHTHACENWYWARKRNTQMGFNLQWRLNETQLLNVKTFLFDSCTSKAISLVISVCRDYRMEGAAKGVGMGQSVTSGFLAVRRKGWLKVNDQEDDSECRCFWTEKSGNNNSYCTLHTRLPSVQHERCAPSPPPLYRSIPLFPSSPFMQRVAAAFTFIVYVCYCGYYDYKTASYLFWSTTIIAQTSKLSRLFFFINPASSG